MVALTPLEFGKLIVLETERIKREWLAKVREHVQASRPFKDADIIDSLGKYLKEVSDALANRFDAKSLATSLATARDHGSTRVQLGYAVRDVAIEYSLLRETILGVGAHNADPMAVAELNRINDSGLINAVEQFLALTIVQKEKQAREEAGIAQRSLQDFFMQAPEPMVILSGPEHIFTAANPPYIEFIGRDPLGRKVRDVFTKEEAGDFFSILDGVYRTGTTYIGKEMPFRKPDPREPGRLQSFWINLSYYPARDPNGSIVGVHAFVHDVTDQVQNRKIIEREKSSAEQERENFRNLFRQTPELVCVLNGPEHRFEFVNTAHAKVLGFNATGQTVREAQPESIEIHGILDDVYKTGVTAELNEIPVTVGDRLRYFNLTYAARRDSEGQIDGVMILGTEMTAQVLSRETLKLQRRALELGMTDAPLPEVLKVMTELVELQSGAALIASVLIADKEEKRLFHGAAPRLSKKYNEAINGISIGSAVGSCGTAAYSKKAGRRFGHRK